MLYKIGLEMDDIYKQIYRSPHFVLDSGDKGSGKSRQQARISYLLSKQGYKILSNMVYKKYNIKSERMTTEKVNPPGIVKVSSWSSIFEIIARHKESDYTKPMLLQLDEFHTYCYKWEYWNPQTTGFLKLVPLLRKLSLCVVGITSSPHLVPKEFTRKENGDCDYIVTKNRKYAKALITSRKYMNIPHIKEIKRKVDAELTDNLPIERYIDEYLKRVSWVSDLSDPSENWNYPVFSSGQFPYQSVTEDEEIKDGRIEYQHLGAGMMELGVTQDNKPFSLHAIMSILSDELPEDVPTKILEYIEGDGNKQKWDNVDYMAETLRRTGGKTKLKPGPKGYFLVTNLLPGKTIDQAHYIIKKARKKLEK